MRAILSDAPGGPESLRLGEALDPVAGPGEVLMTVKAAGVNFADTLIIQDKYQIKPQRPFSPGCEASGIVKAIGAGVETLRVGDRVMAHGFFGALAALFCVKAHNCFKIPNSMPFDEAAGLITTYASALYALQDRGNLKLGETLLVLGAAGGMGIAAVELGKAMGARVIAAASTEEKVAFAKTKGADVGIRYPPGPGLSKDEQRAFSVAIKTQTNGEGADVVYDPVGGDYAEPALRATAWAGRFLTLGYAAGIPRIPLNLCLLKGSQIIGVGMGGFMQKDPDGNVRNVTRLLEFYTEGRIRPHVQKRFSLGQASEALQALSDRSAQGKIVVIVD